MVRRPRYPAWPLAYVAFGLFVLTWGAIRLWQTPNGEQFAQSPPQRMTSPVAMKSRSVAVSLATSTRPPVSPQRNEESTTLPAVADTAPPVASRIEFDPVAMLEPQIELALAPRDRVISPSSPPLLATIDATDHAGAAVVRAAVDRAPQTERAWAYPATLAGGLKTLVDENEHAGTWAGRVLAEIEHLFATDSLAAAAANRALGQLERLSDDAPNVVALCRTREERARILRVSYGLSRRLVVWRQVERLAGMEQVVSVSQFDRESLTALVDKVDAYFMPAPSWREYLLLSRIRAAGESQSEERGALARRVLSRLEASHLKDDQRAILEKPPVTDLAAALKTWASEPVDLPRLLNALEQLEIGESSAAASEVADAYQRLRWSNEPAAQELATNLNTYYRNANVRVAISGELINLLLPTPGDTVEPVDDHVLGARVWGRSQTSARLRVVLMPDLRRLRMNLEASGQVDSSTAATKGPATFYNEGVAQYRARKLLSIDRQGLRVGRSQVEADADSELTDLETDFDALPFVGLLARAMARQQHDENYHAASHEMKSKVAARAESRLDSEVHKQLASAEAEFEKKLHSPLERLQLEPTAVDLHTTNEHLIARYRVAGRHQVASFTPRPQPPAQSMLNVQVHQSLMNNVVAQLKLDGRRTDLETLYREIAATFSQPLTEETLAEMPEKVVIQFAERDAVRVYADGGRLTVVIKLAELSQGRNRKWKDFTVQAHYVPDVRTIDAKLVREGTIELIGEQLGFKEQIALRGIFIKVFSTEHPLSLLPERVTKHPRLKSLVINQFVIDNGWIGVSVAGPGERGQTPVARGQSEREKRR